MAFGGIAMKFLRNDSGHIFIFHGSSSQSSNTAASGHASVVPSVAAPPIVPAVASHCCFICRSCGSPILLPHDQMGMPFAHPSLRRIEVRTIAAVCTSCHYIDNYSLFRGCPGFNTRHKLMPAPTAGTTFLLEWLHCDGSGCPFRVPFFVNFDRNLSYEEQSSLTANWFWQDLTCIAGHRIRPLVSAPRPNGALSAL
jgi:hypothetical protein